MDMGGPGWLSRQVLESLWVWTMPAGQEDGTEIRNEFWSEKAGRENLLGHPRGKNSRHETGTGNPRGKIKVWPSGASRQPGS